MTQENKKFNAEVGKVLHLMINSLYTNKEIFIRELISNSSDACDKLRYLSQTDTKLIDSDSKFKITVSVNKDNKTISIIDNGIGMNRQDLIDNLGTIAKSGTQGFVNQLSGDNKKDSQLIGQFGVGFYSCFMVSDKVTVKSRKAGEDNAFIWESDGKGEYTISSLDTAGFSRGTEITIYIKNSEERSFIDHTRIKNIIKSYSDHIAVPIFLTDEKGKEESQVNSSSALWTKLKNDINTEEYQNFYKNVSHATDEPWMVMHNRNEGVVEFTNLLFIPSLKTFDLFHPDRKCRIKLYIKRVFITDENIDIIPQYLRFIRGVIDSQDLPLNISRETLQHNSTLEKIKRSITKRVLSELTKKKDNSREDYLLFWNNFGGVLKEGLCEMNTEHEKLLGVCMFKSALHNKMISLDEYIDNRKSENKAIYYLSGDDTIKLQNNPQIEGFISKGIDVLLFTDTVDNFWVNVNGRYKSNELKSVTRTNIDLNSSDEKNNMSSDDKEKEENLEYDKIIKYFKDVLGDTIKDVQISKKLMSSPVCLSVSDSAMDIRMERYLIEQKQLAGASPKILEINPRHKILLKMIEDLQNNRHDDNTNSSLVHLLYDQACIIEGEPLTDTVSFAKRLNSVLEKV